MATFGSERVRAIPGSVFVLMDEAKSAARAAGLDVLDMSIGSSDLSPPPEVLEVLRSRALDEACHRYPLPSDSRGLQEAAARYLQRRFNVTVDPRTEVLPCAGAQEALVQLLLAAADPGDVVLLCDPCYAPYLGAVACAGLVPHALPTAPQQASGSGGGADASVPDLRSVPAAVAERAKVLLLNFPSNPAAATAPPGFFAAAAAWCGQRGVLLVHDAPYVELVYGGYAAPVALASVRRGGAVAGGALPLTPLCRAVELFSLSKSHSMGGFRIGFAAGDAGAIAALARVQAVFGFGPPLAIQAAAAAALDLPDEVVRAGAAVFAGRRDTLLAALERSGGWEVLSAALPTETGATVGAAAGERPAGRPGASMYVWARHPRIAAAGGSAAFAVALASQAGVAIAPGSAFGSRGEGCVRFALVLPPPALEAAVARIQRWLAASAS